MYCINCGKEIDDKAIVCPHCGVGINTPEPTEKKPINGLGIAGFVVAILSLWLGVYYCIASIVALVLSTIAFVKRKKYSLSGLTIAGFVISIVSLSIWALVWISVCSALISLGTLI